MARRSGSLLTVVGPGLLVAATGVGAGDLATASLAGARLGIAVAWAALLGAAFKLVLNEGLARWQLATGETLLEGVVRRLGRPAGALFLVYLVPWSFFVGSALISACGVTAHALLPSLGDASLDKLFYGAVHSLLGLLLARLGGFRLFERLMGICIAAMFGTVMVTAILVAPDLPLLFRGLLVPRIPELRGEGLTWTIALMGGVGGSVTMLCYGYWIREKGRRGLDALAVSRVDLGVGYLMTGLFGVAMVVIGSTVSAEGTGASLVVELGDRLAATLGSAGRWAFLVGAWGAVFSSLLGVWQAVPYLFADVWRLIRADAPVHPAGATVSTRSVGYRGYQLALATLPIIGLLVSFRDVQKAYAVVGACFMPLLALVLLILNGRSAWVGPGVRNRPSTVVALVVILLFFLVAGVVEVGKQLAG
jgi:Mn2+/Fe2+ NRAMP family transporter